MAKYVIYTAIFGKKDRLHEPRIVPKGWDFICFTDQPLRSRAWQICRVPPPDTDPTRSARKYKILPHQFLPEYDVSVWVDGNVRITGDVSELVEHYLSDSDVAVLDHARSRSFPLHSLAEELDELLRVEASGKHQDDAALMQQQYQAYMHAGYPDASGMAWTMFLMRRHHEPAVRTAMEAWWHELTQWSKRDQMSFNYAAWKSGLSFAYIPLDGSGNSYFERLNHYLPLPKQVHSYWLGAVKRIKNLFA